MSKLISGKEALIAIGEGKEVQYRFNDSQGWMPQNCLSIDGYISDVACFRIKPKIVEINGVKIFEPNDIVIDAVTGSVGLVYGDIEKSKQVAEVLRSIFNVK